MPTIDYYAILGVPPAATLEQIKQAYRQLARLYHPDLNKDASSDRIKQLNEAYAVLSDAVRRAAYDALLLEERRNAAIRAALRRQQEASMAKRMTWSEGVNGFFSELKKELGDDLPRKKRQPEEHLTWKQGISGFMQELKKGMRE